MSVQELPNGRWRATVKDPSTGARTSAASVLGLSREESTFRNKTAARRAETSALERLRADTASGRSALLETFWQRWITDPLFTRPKESTNIYRQERTAGFVAAYGTLRLDQIDDEIVAEWLEGGKRNGTVKALSAMFNDAASRKAGRLLAVNPFARLGISHGTGNREKNPPSEELVWQMIAAARTVACPSFAAWLQTACFTGMRPGELDAIRWEHVDFDQGWIMVDAERGQFSKATSTFTAPKNGQGRPVPMHAQVRDALLALPRSGEFCFVNMRGDHWTASSRAYHWNAVRAAVGWTESLYLATRHFAGWYMYELLQLPAEDVAFALGHCDKGELVRKLYGHRDRSAALDRVKRAYQGRQHSGLRVVEAS